MEPDVWNLLQRIQELSTYNAVQKLLIQKIVMKSAMHDEVDIQYVATMPATSFKTFSFQLEINMTVAFFVGVSRVALMLFYIT